MTRVAFLIPGDIDLPTGGYAYDRRVLALLAGHGIDAKHIVLPASYPSPAERDSETTAETVASLPQQTVLLIDGLAFGAMPADLIRQFDRPIVALCHHPLALEAGLSPERAAELKASETTALTFARHVIVTSPMTRQILSQDFGVGVDRISVAIPGTDPAPRSRGGGAPLRLLAVGSVVPRKGYDVLVRALEGIGAPDWHLDIAGAEDRSPPTTAALHALVAAAGLDERITLNGAVSDQRLAELYAKADVFVMSSLFEGYGMVLAEAMARGLPIVSTTGGAAAETVPDAAAIKVPPGDAGALAAALRTVMRAAELRAEMSNASWRAGRALPQWDDTARIIADVLRKAAT